MLFLYHQSYLARNSNFREIKKGLYKFESFVFDGFKVMDNMLVMRVKREEEFAPIKNSEGVDSPATALEIYENYKK